MVDSKDARFENTLRTVGTVEGSSLLLLLFVAMPLKYLAGQPLAVSVVGSAHGVLWIVYLGFLAAAWKRLDWSFGTLFLGGVASVLPFGPWFFHNYLDRQSKSP